MRTRALLAFAVMALLAIVPGPVLADGRPAGGIPGISLLVEIVRPRAAPAPERAPDPSPQAAAAERAATVPAEPAAKGVVDVPDAIAPAHDLVRVTTVLYAGTSAPVAGFDLGGPCPRATTCNLFQLSDYRRKTDDTGRVVIRFAYDDSDRREIRAQDEGTVRAALARAMAEWSHWDSNIVFEDTGRSDATFGAKGKDGGCSDGVNVITWDRFEENILGAATTCLDEKHKIVRDTDLALNVNHRWVDGIDRRPQSYDLQSIFTHELGHWLQLQHPDPFFGSRETMYGTAEPNEIFKRTLALGDVLGLQKAYPCDEKDTCPRTGIKDD